MCSARGKRKLELEEQELSVMREKFLNDVKMREEKLSEQLVSKRGQIEGLGVVKKSKRQRWSKKFKDIKSKEQGFRTAQESLAERERKVDLIIGTLDDRINAVEERENGFNLFLEGKMREMVLKEEQLSLKWQYFVKEVNLAEEKFREQEKLRHGVSERLILAENKLEGMRATIGERFREIESRENVVWESVALSVKEADLIRESMEKQLEEFEKMKREFHSFQEGKMWELVSKEHLLITMSKELVKDANLRDEQLTKREKLGNHLLERLELAHDKVKDLKEMVGERFKQIGSKENEVKLIRDWVEKKMDEVDSKGKEVEEQENRIIMKEGNLISKENELQEKKKELDLKEKNLESWQKELEVKQREVDSAQELIETRLEELDWKEKNLNSVKGFTRNCFKEHLAIKKQLRLEKDSVEKRARDLDLKEQKLQYIEKELEFMEKQQDESVDLKFIVRMDGKTLQMFLNDPEKDLESMGDEIFKVLHLSSNPAKLVLDAMVGFYPPHLRKGDVEINVRKTCIILLEQLIKMSKKIQPCIREEAIELASAWKSRMRACAENPLEVLGFLHLLAAYNIASYFEKDEILSFLMMVSQHRQRPLLCRVLGFVESIPASFEEEHHLHQLIVCYKECHLKQLRNGQDKDANSA
ncbi:hypothetical protein DH2020_001305 [Rehmannia glutinosa]|uniref:FRIGIDA-like protein n=1 Tax=Rehmannia glutinosa TaxID=99300 RepID=A0ABR0XZB8_REHGL